MNLNTPALSRFYVRLATESHNCWATTAGGPVDCAGSAARMLVGHPGLRQRRRRHAGRSRRWSYPRRCTLYAGTIASGNNRYDGDASHAGSSRKAAAPRPIDTSGVDPAINLTVSGNTTWDGGWGIDLRHRRGEGAGSTATSSKLYNSIANNGQYQRRAVGGSGQCDADGRLHGVATRAAHRRATSRWRRTRCSTRPMAAVRDRFERRAAADHGRDQHERAGGAAASWS